MARRQNLWATRVRAQLIQELGSRCWACGEEYDLHFDHPFGRDWDVRKAGFAWRISIYRREAKEGLVRLLCEKCNDSKRYNGVTLPRPAQVEIVNGAEVPF